MLSDETTKLSQIVIRDTRTVNDGASLEELISFFDTYDFYGVPVLDDNDHLVGVVLRKTILEAEADKDGNRCPLASSKTASLPIKSNWLLFKVRLLAIPTSTAVSKGIAVISYS